MTIRARDLSPKLAPLIAAGMFCLCIFPARAADDEDPAKGAAVTVLKAAKACFANIVEVSGTVIPREENQVRPERMGLKVAEVMVDAGDSVTAGQVLARLTLPEGGQIAVQAPVGGVISASTASAVTAPTRTRSRRPISTPWPRPARASRRAAPRRCAVRLAACY